MRAAASLAAELRAQPWFELVDSGTNWRDAASKESFQDKFSRSRGFRLSRVALPARW